MEVIRAAGWDAWKLEYWNQWGHILVDAFNFIDVLAVTDDDIVAIQITGPSGHAAHKRKILGNQYAARWVRTGNRIQLRSWRKLVIKRGKKARRWTERIEDITPQMFEEDKSHALTE